LQGGCWGFKDGNGLETARGKTVSAIICMATSKSEINLQIRQLLDAAVLVFALWLAHFIRFGLNEVSDFSDITGFSQFAWLIVVLFPFAPLILELHGYYDLRFEKPLGQSLGQIMQTMVWLGCIVGCCVVFLRLDLPSRAVPLIFVPIGTVGLLMVDRLARVVMRRRAERGELKERVILAGTAEEIAELEAGFTHEQRMVLDVRRRFDLQKEPISELVRAMHEHAVGRVLFIGGRSELQVVEDAVGACDVEGVEVWLFADFIRTRISHPSWTSFSGRPVLVFSSKPAEEWALLLKRLMDLVGAGVGLVLLTPLLLVVAWLIKRDSPGPVFFKQQRSGQHGYPFVMWKFRTMYLDAEERRAELLARNEMGGPVFKLTDDPRITPIGKWLRRLSIDELPQLWNVAKGDMSLVGPRPLPVYEVEQFADRAHRRRLSVKPGLTCLWQISGRNEVTNFEDWVRLDLEYIDRWSLWLDLRILLQTIPVVLWGRGAK